jgi:hypothetical protein
VLLACRSEVATSAATGMKRTATKRKLNPKVSSLFSYWNFYVEVFLLPWFFQLKLIAIIVCYVFLILLHPQLKLFSFQILFSFLENFIWNISTFFIRNSYLHLNFLFEAFLVFISFMAWFIFSIEIFSNWNKGNRAKNNTCELRALPNRKVAAR